MPLGDIPAAFIRKPVPKVLLAAGYEERPGTRILGSCRSCAHLDARHKCAAIPGRPSVKRGGFCPKWTRREDPSARESGRLS